MECIKCKAPLPDGAIYCPMCGKKQTAEKSRRTKSRGNGTGTVYKCGSTWVAEVTKGYRTEGKKTQRIKSRKYGFKTKKEALEYLPVLKGRQEREKDITWQKLYDLWLPTHRAGKSTINCYKAAEKYFSEIAFWKLRDIEIDDLQECIDDCPHGRRTRENMKALGNLIYKYAIPRGYASLNLAYYLIISGERGQEREGLPIECLPEIEKAIDIVPYADYIYCMCYLGFRPSEFLSLDIKNYDRKNKTLTGGAKTAAGKNRVVPIAEKIQPIVDRLTKGRTEGAVFCDENGGFFNYAYFRTNCFYPALDAIGIDNPVIDNKHKYSPHCCRHTFATLLKKIKAADADKMKLIGHASPEMLRYYQDVNIEDLKKIVNAM